jgi:hypothetical protein
MLKKVVLKYGLMSGAVLAALSAILMPLCLGGIIDFKYQELVGFTAMIVAFLLVFFGIRTYRDDILGGSIGFWKGLQVGILISLITCAVYVVAWEIVYFNFLPDFEETYSTHVINKMREDGASAAEVGARQEQMETFKRLYKNIFFNVGVTFLEVFPVGLIVSLVSAGILRRRLSEPPAPEGSVPEPSYPR